MDEFWSPKVGEMVRTRESYAYMGPPNVGVLVEVGEDRNDLKVLFRDGRIKHCFYYQLEEA
jgi:hypothetical protein